jgi:Tol biopolymer transport system component
MSLRVRGPLWAMLVAALVFSAKPLHGAFPGENGRIIFLQGPNGFQPNIFSMNPDGTGERQITHFDGVDLCCEAPSPDGRRIVFTEFPPGARGELWMVNSDGSGLHKVLSEPDSDNFIASFTPDGLSLVFTRCNDIGCAIFRMRTDGSLVEPITKFRQEILDFHPVVSPDGQKIAFDSFNRGGILGATYLINSDGSGLHQLTPSILGAQEPDWSPDGKRLVFETHCCNPQNPELWSINVDGTGLKAITHPGVNQDLRASWAPEGNAITFDRCFVSLNKCAIYVLDMETNRETMVRQMDVPVVRQNFAKRRLQSGPLHNHPRQIEFDAFRAKWAVAH